MEETKEENGIKIDKNELAPLNPNEYKDTLANNDVKRKLTIKQRLKLIKDNVTVEPIMACYIMPSVLSSLAMQNLALEKACRVNLNFTEEVCNALTLRETANYTYYEVEVQKLIASVQAWKNIIQTTIPVVLILFVGAWSDKTGKRKACILMPIVGEFITCLGFIINNYFFYELPVEVLALTETIFPAITGGWFTNIVGVFSYIGDITTKEDRTYRVGLVNIFMSLGYPIGCALSGVLLNWIGYYGIFCCSAVLYLFNLNYGFFILKEPNNGRRNKPSSSNTGCIGFLREFFDLKLVGETFKVAFKHERRVRVAIIFVAVFTIFGPMQGEWTIMYLFTRYRFNWDAVQFSMWSTYGVVVNLLGTMFSISLFTNYLKLDDTLLGIISCTSKIVASFAYAFARNNWEIYFASFLEVLNGTSFIALRSIASKMVTGDDFGKVNSLIGLAEAATPLLYGPMYTQVYSATLSFLPGFVFLVGSMLTLPAIGIFGWLYFEHKKDLIRSKALKSDGEKG